MFKKKKKKKKFIYFLIIYLFIYLLDEFLIYKKFFSYIKINIKIILFNYILIYI